MDARTHALTRPQAAGTGDQAAAPAPGRRPGTRGAGGAFLKRFRAAFLFHLFVNLAVLTLGLGIVAGTYMHFVQRPRVQMVSTVYASNLAALAASIQALPPSGQAAHLAQLARSSKGLVAADDPRHWGLVEPPSLLVREFFVALRQRLPGYTVGFTPEPRPLLWIAVPVQDRTHWIRMDLPTFVEVPTGIFAAALLLVLVTVSGGAAYALARLRSRVARVAQAIDQVDPRAGHVSSLPLVAGGEDLLDLDRHLRDMADRVYDAQAEHAILVGQFAGDLRVLLRRLGQAHSPHGAPPEVAECLRHMQRSVQQLEAFVQPSHVDSGYAVDMDEVLSQLAQEASAAGRSVSLEPGGVPYTGISPAVARRLVGNLVDNALRYAGHAELSTAVELGWVVVRVRDRGPGVSPHELPLLGKAFYRTDAARAQGEGSGLGLAIVKQEVQAVKGELRLSLPPGGGLQAELRLRLARLP